MLIRLNEGVDCGNRVVKVWVVVIGEANDWAVCGVMVSTSE